MCKNIRSHIDLYLALHGRKQSFFHLLHGKFRARRRKPTNINGVWPKKITAVFNTSRLLAGTNNSGIAHLIHSLDTDRRPVLDRYDGCLQSFVMFDQIEILSHSIRMVRSRRSTANRDSMIPPSCSTLSEISIPPFFKRRITSVK